MSFQWSFRVTFAALYNSGSFSFSLKSPSIISVWSGIISFHPPPHTCNGIPSSTAQRTQSLITPLVLPIKIYWSLWSSSFLPSGQNNSVSVHWSNGTTGTFILFFNFSAKYLEPAHTTSYSSYSALDTWSGWLIFHIIYRHFLFLLSGR